MKTLVLIRQGLTRLPIINDIYVTPRVLVCLKGVLDHEGVACEIVEGEVIENATPLISPDIPRGPEGLKSAGVPEAVIQRWFENQIDMIQDDPKGVARQDLGNLDYDELVDDVMNGDADDDWEALCEDPSDIANPKTRAIICWYADIWRKELTAEPDMDKMVKDELNGRLKDLEGWLKEYPEAPVAGEDDGDDDDDDDMDEED